MSYDSVFTERAESYLYAVNTYPSVMYYEDLNIVKSLNIKENDKILHVACAGVYIKPYIDVSCEYIRVEQNETMARLDNALHCPLDSIPYENESFDKIVIVATLHHYTDNKRASFYKEVSRLLKPEGQFLLCDVEKGSEQDYLLNTCVDKYNPGGHKGIFFTKDYTKTLQTYFKNINVSLRSYPWVFKSVDDFNIYCNSLFYLKKLKVEHTFETLQKYITILSQKNNTLHMNWKLLYFTCEK